MDKGNKKREILVPILCVLLSVGLWFYVTNIENPIKVIEVDNVPVKVVNEESLKNLNLALAPNQEYSVDLKVEGLGNQVYKLNANDFKLQVDISDYALKKGNNKIPVTIVSSPSSVTIKNDNSLSINVAIEDLVDKKISVKSNVKVGVDKGFSLSDVETNPKEVVVSGPKSLVNTVTNVVAIGEINNVSSNVSNKYPLMAINDDEKEVKGVKLSQDTAEVSIKVNQGKSVPVKINTVKELPTGLKLGSIDATRKTIYISGSKEALDKVSEVSTTPIDLSTINDTKKISLKIIPPEGVSISAGEEFVDVTVNITKESTVKNDTKTFDVPVTISGQREGLLAVANSKTVKVTISGAENIVNNISLNKISATINIDTHKEEGTFELTPEVSVEGVDKSSISISQDKVSVIISKTQQDKPSEAKPQQQN